MCYFDCNVGLKIDLIPNKMLQDWIEKWLISHSDPINFLTYLHFSGFRFFLVCKKLNKLYYAGSSIFPLQVIKSAQAHKLKHVLLLISLWRKGTNKKMLFINKRYNIEIDNLSYQIVFGSEMFISKSVTLTAVGMTFLLPSFSTIFTVSTRC